MYRKAILSFTLNNLTLCNFLILPPATDKATCTLKSQHANNCNKPTKKKHSGCLTLVSPPKSLIFIAIEFCKF